MYLEGLEEGSDRQGGSGGEGKGDGSSWLCQ